MRTVNIIMIANNNKKTLSLMYIFLGRMATILKRATATTTTTTTTTIAAAAAAANMVSRASGKPGPDIRSYSKAVNFVRPLWLYVVYVLFRV